MNGTHVLAFALGVCFLLSAQVFAALLLNKRKPTPKDGRCKTATLCGRLK